MAVLWRFYGCFFFHCMPFDSVGTLNLRFNITINQKLMVSQNYYSHTCIHSDDKYLSKMKKTPANFKSPMNGNQWIGYRTVQCTVYCIIAVRSVADVSRTNHMPICARAARVVTYKFILTPIRVRQTAVQECPSKNWQVKSQVMAMSFAYGAGCSVPSFLIFLA